jgi:hypothetical protein
MPRVRHLNDDVDQGHVLRLARPAARIRRAFELTDDRPIEDPRVRARTVPPQPGRYLLIQEYADEGRECGHAIAFGDDAAKLLKVADDQMSDGWVPVEIHDLDTGHSWGIGLAPVLYGPVRPPGSIIERWSA